MTGLLITGLELDWNLKICFYALWYAVTTNNYLDLLEPPCPRDAFQL